MSAKQSSIVALVLVVGVASIFLHDGLNADRHELPPKNLLSIKPNLLDFGERFACESLSWQVLLENTSKADIYVTGIDSSCGCAFVGDDKFLIGGNKTASVELKLNLQRKDAVLDLSSRQFMASFLVKYDIAEGKQTASLGMVKKFDVSGIVHDTAICLPRIVDFGEVTESQVPIEKLLTVRLAEGLRVDRFCTSPGIVVKYLDDGTDTWKVMLNRSASREAFPGWIQAVIKKNGDESADEISRINVPVIGNLVANFVARPGIQSCGFLHSNKPIEVRFAICGASTEKIRVVDVRAIDGKILRVSNWQVIKKDEHLSGEIHLVATIVPADTKETKSKLVTQLSIGGSDELIDVLVDLSFSISR